MGKGFVVTDAGAAPWDAPTELDVTRAGAATAAFVMPSCVSGRPAHRADPIANDQDWALYWPLFLSADLCDV